MKNRQFVQDVDKMFSGGSNKGIYNNIISQTEKVLIEKALKRSFGNQSIAAKLLGINRNTMRMKIKKLGIDVAEFKI
jgi:Fis family transcriptional regulator